MLKLPLILPMCRSRTKGAAWLPVCLVLPVLIIRTSSATSLFTPSSRPTVCSPLFLLAGSRYYTPRLPPALMSAPLWRQAPKAAKANVAAAGRDLSSVLRQKERTSEATASCPATRPLRRKASTPKSETADKRRMYRPAWKPSPHWRLPQKTLIRTVIVCFLGLIKEKTPPCYTCDLVTFCPLGTWPHLYPIRGNIITLPLVLHIPETSS